VPDVAVPTLGLVSQDQGLTAAGRVGPDGGGPPAGQTVNFNHTGDVIYTDQADEDRVVRKQLFQLRVAGLT
jgi:hypothetical protein